MTRIDHTSGLSHVIGPTIPKLLDVTVGQALSEAARRWPEREALVSVPDGARLTFAQLDAKVSKLAAGFRALGLTSGDRIGIWSPNNAGWALTQFAAARAGLILVTINPAYRIGELEYSLRKLGVSAVMTATSFKSSDYLAMIEELAPELVRPRPGTPSRLPNLKLLLKIDPGPRKGWITLADSLALGGEAPLVDEVDADPNAAVNVQFTSGTTGLPKGAVLTHRNIINNGYMVGRQLGLRAGDRICIPVPLYHCFGMVMGNLACVIHGATMIYPGAGFEPAATLSTVAAEHCTHLYGVPTMFIAMLGHADFHPQALGSLRGGIMAGAPCPVEVMKEVIDRMNMREITIAYGMTETSPVSFQTNRDDPIELRVSTVGRVQPHLQCKLVDPEGHTIPLGSTGELCTKGYSVMLGYWDDPARTAETIDADGWLHTGDLATFDHHGYCRIVGRLKDMIIRGGENIYPREIEEYLHGHPDVEDVAVVGVPDRRFGEEVCAWLRLKPGASICEEDVREYCRQNIAHYKVPRYVRIVDSFPVTVTGKIQKFEIREQMISILQSPNPRDSGQAGTL